MSGRGGSYADAINIPPSPLSANQGYGYGQQQQSQQIGGYHQMPPPLTNPPSFSSDFNSDPPSSYSSSLPRYNQGPSPLSPQFQQQQQQQPGGPRPPPKSGSTHPDPRLYPAHPLSNSYSYADSPTATLRGESTDDLGKKLGNSEKAPLQPTLSYNNRPDSGGFRRISGAFVNGKKVPNDDHDPSSSQSGLIRRKRLGYLDGLKFVSAMIILNATLFDAAVSNNAYTFIQRGSPLYVLRDANIGIVAFLMLSARSILEPLWDVPAPTSASAMSSASGEKKPAPKEPSIAWYKVARAMLTRPFRFILPVLVIAATQWGLRATDKTSNCNAVGMNEPYWNQIRNFAGYATLVFNMFTWFELDTAAGMAFGANLWFTPWLFQSSYCAYVAHIMLGNLSSNRYWVYFLLFAFSWFSFNFFAVAVVGVAICDMAAHGQFARIHKFPFLVKLALAIAIIAFGCAIEFIGPIRTNLNSALATVNVTDHTEIQFADIIFVACFLLAVEISQPLQWILGNVVMRLLGKLSAGLVLLAPSITFTVVPDLALSMSRSGSNGSAILGVTWVVLFLACFGLAIVFHFLVELPSKLAGEYFADFCMNWGRTDSTRAAIKEANAKAKSAIKAPVNAAGKLKKGGK